MSWRWSNLAFRSLRRRSVTGGRWGLGMLIRLATSFALLKSFLEGLIGPQRRLLPNRAAIRLCPLCRCDLHFLRCRSRLRGCATFRLHLLRPNPGSDRCRGFLLRRCVLHLWFCDRLYLWEWMLECGGDGNFIHEQTSGDFICCATTSISEWMFYLSLVWINQ